MIDRLRNMLSQVIYAPMAASSQRVSSISSDNNPFVNPFIQQQSTPSRTYAVNRPVKGGYFAGYYNGQPNIVGRKLFIEA